MPFTASRRSCGLPLRPWNRLPHTISLRCCMPRGCCGGPTDTQNVDSLGRAAGLPAEALVQAHGSFDRATCIETGASVPISELRAAVQCGKHAGPDGWEALPLARAVAALPQLVLRGLMAIPEPAPDFEAQRALFLRATALFDQIRDAGIALDTLSLGMSADLEAAVSAGSTMVRIGTAIFGGRPKKAA